MEGAKKLLCVGDDKVEEVDVLEIVVVKVVGSLIENE